MALHLIQRWHRRYSSSLKVDKDQVRSKVSLPERTQSPLHTGDASPCCGLWWPRTQLMPTAPRTMLATPSPTSTTDSRSRLHRILRLEHILPRASLQLQQGAGGWARGEPASRWSGGGSAASLCPARKRGVIREEYVRNGVHKAGGGKAGSALAMLVFF